MIHPAIVAWSQLIECDDHHNILEAIPIIEFPFPHPINDLVHVIVFVYHHTITESHSIESPTILLFRHHPINPPSHTTVLAFHQAITPYRLQDKILFNPHPINPLEANLIVLNTHPQINDVCAPKSDADQILLFCHQTITEASP